MENAEFLVKYGLPLILLTLIILISISFIIIKFIMNKNYFDYVTHILLKFSDWEIVELIKINDKNNQEQPDSQNASSSKTSLILNQNDFYKNQEVMVNLIDRKIFLNFQCNYIKIDPSSIFIQFPYLTRFLSYVLFWGYFSIQTFCLEEIFSDSILDGYKCFNVSIKVTGKLYR